MAELRSRCGRGTLVVAHKVCNHYLLKTQRKQGKRALHRTSLSSAFLFADIKLDKIYGAESAEDESAKVTAGVPRDSCTRGTPLLCAGERCFGVGDGYSRSDRVHSFRERHVTWARSHTGGRRRLCLGHGPLMFARAYSGTRTEPLYKTKNGYYEILEVSPTATHAQIKTAYYKQSFVYHPDRNAGSDEATVRFSEINEAYTVLGNKGLRKKYDRGLLSASDLTATARPSSRDATGGSAKPQSAARRSVMSADGQGGVFDFDKFFRSHYSEQLQRDRDIRLRREEMLKRKRESIEEKKLGRTMEIGVIVLFMMAVGLIINLKQG